MSKYIPKEEIAESQFDFMTNLNDIANREIIADYREQIAMIRLQIEQIRNYYDNSDNDDEYWYSD